MADFPLDLPPSNRKVNEGDPAGDHNQLTQAVASLAQQVGTAMDGKSSTGHDHDSRYVRTVNGTGPDAAGNVTVAAGGGGGAVESVNGKTGAVTLGAGDVGAIPSGVVAAHWKGTQAQYDALATKNATTLYLITGA